MTTFYVVTYGNGELLSQVFSAIAQALHGNNATFKTLFHLSLVLGSTWALVNMILQRNLLAGVQWLGIYYVAFYVLLLPASSVDIVDRINNTDTIVDNVPLGVAAMASYTSAIGDSVTHLVDSNFSFDEQLRYSQSGMAMSSALVSAASNFQIADPDFEQNLQAFLNQCVFYDVLGGKYTTKDLLTNTDLWGFVKGHASAIRTFLYDRSLTTCKDGSTLLEGKWADVIQEMATRYGTRLFPDIQTNGKAADKLIDNLGISYHFLSDGAITADGRFLIQQNAMSNAIYNGILAWASRVGAGAAVSNGNFNRTVQQNRMSAQSTGQDMGSWVSMLKNVCEGISYGAFVIMILLMLFPIGWRLLKNYIYTLFWIQSWAPLYAIINMYVNYYAQHRTAAALLSLQAQGGTTDIFGISIITQASIAHINIDMISLAGYLCMSVPMIAAGLIKGGSMAFNGLMGHMNNASSGSGSGSDFATPHHATDPGLNPTNTTPNSFDSLVSQLAYPKHTQGHDTPTPHNDFDQGIYHPNSLENTAKTGHFSDDHAGKSQLDPNHDPSTSPHLSETQKTTENPAHFDTNHQPSHHNDDGQSTSTNGLDTANIDSKHADNHANHAADDTHHAASHATSQHADSSGEARFIGAVTDSENHNSASANAHMASNHSAPSHSENANEHSSASEHSGDSGSVNHGGENANTHLEDSGNANHASENSNHMPASQSMDTNHVAHDHASSEPASSGHPESNHLENPSQNSDPHFTAEPSDYLNHDATHNNAHSSSESSGTLNQDTAHLENHTSAHETDTAQSLQSTEREPEISTAFGEVLTDTSAQMCIMGEKSDQQITQDISQTHLENQSTASSNDHLLSQTITSSSYQDLDLLTKSEVSAVLSSDRDDLFPNASHLYTRQSDIIAEKYAQAKGDDLFNPNDPTALYDVAQAHLSLNDNYKLTHADYAEVAKDLKCEPEVLQAIAKVESGKEAFDAHGRLVIRFEPTHFSSDGTHPELSSGTSHDGPERNYKIFEKAYQVDPEAALEACSWGKFQLMGENYDHLGFSSPQEMVKTMAQGEKAQLPAFKKFLQYKGLEQALQEKDWGKIASGYNGKHYKDGVPPGQKTYDQLLKKNYDEIKAAERKEEKEK